MDQSMTDFGRLAVDEAGGSIERCGKKRCPARNGCPKYERVAHQSQIINVFKVKTGQRCVGRVLNNVRLMGGFSS